MGHTTTHMQIERQSERFPVQGLQLISVASSTIAIIHTMDSYHIKLERNLFHSAGGIKNVVSEVSMLVPDAFTRNRVNLTLHHEKTQKEYECVKIHTKMRCSFLHFVCLYSLHKVSVEL